MAVRVRKMEIPTNRGPVRGSYKYAEVLQAVQTMTPTYGNTEGEALFCDTQHEAGAACSYIRRFRRGFKGTLRKVMTSDGVKYAVWAVPNVEKLPATTTAAPRTGILRRNGVDTPVQFNGQAHEG